ncbi:hypothetical protein ACEQ8H_005843 [Pleosporales sp. CAS-2024a]
MQYTIATLATLFTAAISAPSDISSRQATTPTLVTYTDAGCSDNNLSGRVLLTNLGPKACPSLPAGIVGGKIAENLPSGCTIVFYVGQGCLSQETYTYPTSNLERPHDCFTLGGPDKPIGSYRYVGNCPT